MPAFSRGASAPRSAAALIAAALVAAPATASIINFEPDSFGNLPDGSAAVDNMSILDQYEAAFGIRFGLDADKDLTRDAGDAPLLDLVGEDDPGNGFLNDPDGQYDFPRPEHAAELGDYFLRTEGLSGDLASLLIEYTAGGTFEASGQIWDIDGSNPSATEQWLVTAYDASGNPVDSMLSPLGDDNSAAVPTESAPWTWSFDVMPDGPAIEAILIEFVGSKTNNVGLAFDNFAPRVVPTPGSAALAAMGLALVARKRRRD